MTAQNPVAATVACAWLGLIGCKERTETAPVPRYAAVKAPSASASHWCDTTLPPGALRLTLPPLAPPGSGRGQPALPAGKRVWMNLWATWCQPCLREMPLLLKWQDDLRQDGVDVDVILLSLDEDADALQKFLGEHKDIPAAKVARVASQAAYEHWVKSYVKDPGAPIPIHLLAAEGSVRCVRGGSLRESDYPAAKAALH